MPDTSIKTSELSSRNILISPNTQFLILDKGIKTQSEAGSTMTTPASAVISLVGAAYNLTNLSNLFTGFASQSANNLSNYTTVNTNSAVNWNYQGTDVKSLTSNWQNTYTNFYVQSANNLSNYTTVNTYSATWNTGGGTDTAVRALTGNWQNTYTTVNTNSATWNAGGSALIRASESLQANTTSESPATSPPQLEYNFNGFTTPHASGSVSLTYDATTYTIYLQDDNPGSGDAWVDTTSYNTDSELAGGLATAINTLIGLSCAVAMGQQCQVNNAGTGSSAILNGSGTHPYIVSIAGGGSGSNINPASGAISEVTLVAAVSGKSIKPVWLSIDGNITGADVSFYFKSSGGGYSLLTAPRAANTAVACPPAGNSGPSWLNGLVNQSLIARFTPETIAGLPDDSSYCWCGAIVEQY